MQFDWVEGVEKFDMVKFKNELSQYFTTQKLGFPFIAEEDDAKVFGRLFAVDLGHKELKIFNEEFRVQQLFFGWWKLSP